jgi:hypothetical protein
MFMYKLGCPLKWISGISQKSPNFFGVSLYFCGTPWNSECKIQQNTGEYQGKTTRNSESKTGTLWKLIHKKFKYFVCSVGMLLLVTWFMETWNQETLKHGDMETWKHGDVETWRHGVGNIQT